MAIFPNIELEELIQVGDKTRIDCTKTYKTANEADISKVQVNPNGTFNLRCSADFSNEFGNLNYGFGNLSGTLVGTAVIASGKLDAGAAGVCYWDAVDNGDFLQTGTIRFKYTPQYTGGPGATGAVIMLRDATATNYIQIKHNPSTSLQVVITDSTGVLQISNALGNWSPVSGTEYEIELNIDVTTGATRLFIDGVQFGSTQTDTFTRGAVTQILLGAEQDDAAVLPIDAHYDDLVIWDTVQHTSDYTIGYTVEAALDTDYIDVTGASSSDWYLDWEYGTDSGSPYTVTCRVTTDGVPVTSTDTIEVISAADDTLFSDDTDLIMHEADILKWVPSGRNSFLNIHRRAQERILAWLDEGGYTDSDGNRITKAAILDLQEVKEWSLFMTLRLIFEGISNAVDDVFDQKAKKYASREKEARSRDKLRIDFDGDGVIDTGEYFTIESPVLRRR